MEKQVTGGVIKYRVPNIAELLVMLGEMGFDMGDLASFGEKTKEGEEPKVSPKQMVFMGKLISRIEPFIESVEVLRVDGKKINTFSGLLENASYLSDLNEIGAALMNALGVSSEKKD